MVRAELAMSGFDPADRLRQFVDRLGAADGAVATFTGLARGSTREGAGVQALFLEHHPILTKRSLDDIAAAAAARFPVSAVEVIHRCGTIRPREPIVWVAVSSSHRRAAFEAADYLMDRLKTEAVFWKREDGPDGSTWIEPTDGDHADRGRWE